MNSLSQHNVAASIAGFRLPAYQDIPDVGLYLEQTAKYISDFLAPLQYPPVTGSMISNYVKKGLIKSPVRKQYDREQIAYLIFIAVAKSVMTIDDLHLMIHIQQQTYPSQIAYDYFRDELRLMLEHVFGGTGEIDSLGENATDQKIMLRNLIIAVAHKVYLDKLFVILRASQDGAASEPDEKNA